MGQLDSVELALSEAPEGDLIVVNGDVIYIQSALAAVLEPTAGDLFLGVADEEFDDEAMKRAWPRRPAAWQVAAASIVRRRVHRDLASLSCGPAMVRQLLELGAIARPNGD